MLGYTRQSSLYLFGAFLPLAAGLMRGGIFVKVIVQSGEPTTLQAWNPLSALRQLFKYSRQPAEREERRSQNDWRWSKENTNKHESAGIFHFPAPEWMQRNFLSNVQLTNVTTAKAGSQEPCLSEVLHWTNFPFLILRTTQIYSGSEKIDFSLCFFFLQWDKVL